MPPPQAHTSVQAGAIKARRRALARLGRRGRGRGRGRGREIRGADPPVPTSPRPSPVFRLDFQFLDAEARQVVARAKREDLGARRRWLEHDLALFGSEVQLLHDEGQPLHVERKGVHVQWGVRDHVHLGVRAGKESVSWEVSGPAARPAHQRARPCDCATPHAVVPLLMRPRQCTHVSTTPAPAPTYNRPPRKIQSYSLRCANSPARCR